MLNLTIDGTSCQHCVTSVQKALNILDGAQASMVHPCSAQLQIEPGNRSIDEILETMRVEGFAMSVVADMEEEAP